MPLRTGIDATSIDRIESVLERFEEKFQKRFFREHLDESGNLPELPPRTYAGLWAAKEAVFKAIGRGYRWMGVEINYEPSGRPVVQIDYKKARLEETVIPREAEWDCSITHDGGLAIAFAACRW